MIPSLLIVVATALNPPQISSVRTERTADRTALRVVTTGPTPPLEIHREGADLVLFVAANPPTAGTVSRPIPPVRGVTVSRTPGGTSLRVQVAPDVRYVVQREPAEFALVFEGPAAAPQPQQTPPATADVKSLFPEGLPETAPALAPVSKEAPRVDGIPFGSLTLQPAVVFNLVRADIFPNIDADRPVKVRDTYLQIEPRLGAELPLGRGTLRGAYEPSLRRGTDFKEVRDTSHRLSGGVELPVGQSIMLRAGDQWSRGILDVTQVDPGQEYFFRLGKFRHNLFDANARLDTGVIDGDIGITLNRVTIDPGSGFFPHRSRSLYFGIGRALGASTHVRLGYANERVPRLVERPEVESRSNLYSVTLDGVVAPLTDGQIFVGYRDQKMPNAAAGGQRFKGLVLAGRLEKEFTRAARLSVWGSRDTRVDLLRRSGLYRDTSGLPELALPTLSAFEKNAFYLVKALNGELTFPLPLEFAGRGGVAWQRNNYETVATVIDAKRADKFFGWSVGLGRPLTRHAWIRADYRWDRRNSNIDRFDVKTDALIFQLGLGYSGFRNRPGFYGATER